MINAKELRIGNWITDRGKAVDLRGSQLVNIITGKYVIEYAPIPLTEEWLIKLGFENWGLGTQWNNQYESYVRYVLHNVLDGTSNFEVHYVHSNYGGEDHYQYIISCDEDDRINWGADIEHVHQLQNLYFALTQKELNIK